MERKKVWLRVGMSIPNVSEEDFNRMAEDSNFAEEFIRRTVEDGTAKLDGETYAPESDGDDQFWGFKDGLELDL